MSHTKARVLVGQANCLGAGLTYGCEYGNPWDLLREAGFDAADIGGDPKGPARVWGRAARRERRAIAARGLDIVCYHSVGLKPWAPVRANLALQDRHLCCARLKGARLFLVHGLWEDFKCFDLRSRRARTRQLDFDVRTLSALARRVREYGLRLVVENNPGFPADYYVELMEQLDAAEAGAILDTGHALLQPPGPTTPIGELIHRLGKRIEHVHLHDNDGVADQHLPVLSGFGTLDWVRVFRALKQAGYRGVLNEELPPMTGIAWTVWALKTRKAQPLRDLWSRV